jgi:hypothetical protein
MEHNDFKGCLRDIEIEGGKAGAGMLEYLNNTISDLTLRRLGTGQNTEQVCSSRNMLAKELHSEACMAGWGFYN